MTTYYIKNIHQNITYESVWDDEKLIIYVFSNNQLFVESLNSSKPKMIIAAGIDALVMFEKIRANSEYEENCSSE